MFRREAKKVVVDKLEERLKSLADRVEENHNELAELKARFDSLKSVFDGLLEMVDQLRTANSEYIKWRYDMVDGFDNILKNLRK